jgi:hypothetical protein
MRSASVAFLSNKGYGIVETSSHRTVGVKLLSTSKAIPLKVCGGP